MSAGRFDRELPDAELFMLSAADENGRIDRRRAGQALLLPATVNEDRHQQSHPDRRRNRTIRSLRRE